MNARFQASRFHSFGVMEETHTHTDTHILLQIANTTRHFADGNTKGVRGKKRRGGGEEQNRGGRRERSAR